MAANTTFVATTTEGNTVVRTSGTRTYTHVCMATKGDQAEGAMSWHGDEANATKAAQTWAGRGFITRVVPVEQALTGKEARLAIEAAKATPVDAVDLIDQALATGTKAAAKKAVAKVAQVAVAAPVEPTKVVTAPVTPAAPQVDTTEFERLLEDIRMNELEHAKMVAARNAMVAKLNGAGLSYAKIAVLTGLSPMATRAMAQRATA